MEGFTLVDAGVAIIVLLSGVLAYSRGFVREAMAIVGWIGATIVAFIFADQVEPLVRQIPIIGDFIGDSCELAIIAAFAAVFAVALVVVSIFTPLFSSVIQRSALGGVDHRRGHLPGGFVELGHAAQREGLLPDLAAVRAVRVGVAAEVGARPHGGHSRHRHVLRPVLGVDRDRDGAAGAGAVSATLAGTVETETSFLQGSLATAAPF